MRQHWDEFVTRNLELEGIHDPFATFPNSSKHLERRNRWLWFVPEDQTKGMTDQQLVSALAAAFLCASKNSVATIVTNGVADVDHGRRSDDRRANFLIGFASRAEQENGFSITLICLNDVFTRQRPTGDARMAANDDLLSLLKLSTAQRLNSEPAITAFLENVERTGDPTAMNISRLTAGRARLIFGLGDIDNADINAFVELASKDLGLVATSFPAEEPRIVADRELYDELINDAGRSFVRLATPSESVAYLKDSEDELFLVSLRS